MLGLLAAVTLFVAYLPLSYSLASTYPESIDIQRGRQFKDRRTHCPETDNYKNIIIRLNESHNTIDVNLTSIGDKIKVHYYAGYLACYNVYRLWTRSSFPSREVTSVWGDI